MSTLAAPVSGHSIHPVHVHVDPVAGERDRVSVGFRFILAIPHLLLVGAPAAVALTWSETSPGVTSHDWTMGGGALGAVAALCGLIGYFAILFTGRYPQGLRSIAVFYLRWRVRASAYMALLRDEYPPFGEGSYGAQVELPGPPAMYQWASVAFRPILIIPQAIAVWALGFAWCLTTIVAWFAIVFTGEYPPGLYRFATGVLQWTTRVEAYALLLHDEYPPFAFEPTS